MTACCPNCQSRDLRIEIPVVFELYDSGGLELSEIPKLNKHDLQGSEHTLCSDCEHEGPWDKFSNPANSDQGEQSLQA